MSTGARGACARASKALGQFQDHLPLVLAHRRDRQSRLANQLYFRKPRLGLDCREGDGTNRPDWLDPYRNPVGIPRVRLRLAHDTHDPDYGLVGHAVIEKGLVALLHRLEMQPRGIVADPVPFGPAVAHKVRPAVAFRFRLHQPVGHWFPLLSCPFGTRPTKRVEWPVKRAPTPVDKPRKMNELKGFRIPSRVANGSPP